MNKREISLGTILGVKITIDISWFWLLAVVIWSFFITNQVVAPFQSTLFYFLIAILQAIVFFGSVILHELGHSYIALKNNIPVQKITLFLFGGVSSIVKEPSTPRVELVMSFAGPLMSLAVGLLFIGISSIMGSDNFFGVLIFGFLGYINIFLAVFNLLPGFPLDGGRILRSFIWTKTKNIDIATRFATNFGQIIGWLLILLGIFELVFLFSLGGLWLVIIGFYIFQSAKASYRQFKLIQILELSKVEAYFESEPLVVAGDEITTEVLRKMILAHAKVAFVKENDILKGLFYLTNKNTDVLAPIRQNTKDIKKMQPISLDDNISKALESIAYSNYPAIPVTDNQGKIVGAITIEDIDLVLKVN